VVGVAVPVTISTMRKRKGLAFPVPRTILLEQKTLPVLELFQVCHPGL
jgi:hypothetical protein